MTDDTMTAPKKRGRPFTKKAPGEPVGIMPPATAAAIEANRPPLIAMELLRNYRPAGQFEIVGYMRPAVVQKDAAGREIEVEPAKFIAGVGKPAPQPGVGTAGKIWAGTVIRVPHDEARTMRANGIAERSVDD
jgi:hypothetical protein